MCVILPKKKEKLSRVDMLRIEKEWLIIFLIVLIVGFTFRNGKGRV